MEKKRRAYIGIGSNIGERLSHIERCLQLIKKSPDIEDVRISPIYETEPMGFSSSNMFLNGVVQVNFTCAIFHLYSQLLEIERQFHRVEGKPYGDREIDLDLLAVDEMIITSEALVVPHPKMHLRKFVLNPFKDLNNNWIHPIYHKTIEVLLQEAQNDETKVFALNESFLV